MFLNRIGNASYILYFRRTWLGFDCLPCINDRSQAFQRNHANDVDFVYCFRNLLRCAECKIILSYKPYLTFTLIDTPI